MLVDNIEDIKRVSNEDRSGIIPPIFHWIWYDFSKGKRGRRCKDKGWQKGKGKEKDRVGICGAIFPDKYRANLNTFFKHNKDYIGHVWNQDEVEDLIRREYPQYYSLYNSLIYPVQKVDLARIFILHYFGGIYADTDMRCCRSLDGLRQRPILLPESLACPHMNCFMMSHSKHPFWLDYIKNIQKMAPYTRFFALFSRFYAVMVTTGPRVLSFTANRNRIKGEPADMFVYPEDKKNPNSYTVHDSDNNWINITSEARKAFILLLIIVIITIIIMIILIVMKKI